MRLLIEPEMVLDYLIFKMKSGHGFRLFFLLFHTPSNKEALNARVAAFILITDEEITRKWIYLCTRLVIKRVNVF